MTHLFDDHVESYESSVDASVAFSGRSVDFFAKRKADELLHLARRLGEDPARSTVLDIGCGVGVTDAHLVDRCGTLHGIDVAVNAVETATLANPSVSYQAYDGERLPFDDATFDIAFAICVLHHVEFDDHGAFVAEVARTLRPGGLFAVFEHNPFNPLTRAAVSRCAFDEGVRLLRRSEVRDLLHRSGLSAEEQRYLLFLPWGGPRALRVDRALRRVPLGGQHCVVGRKPRRP